MELNGGGGYDLNYPEQAWLRWWDLHGNLLLTGREQTNQERQEKEKEQQKRQQLLERLRSLTVEQLGALGIEPTLLE